MPNFKIVTLKLAYRWSQSAGTYIPVNEMNPCHIINAMRKEFDMVSAKEMWESPLFRSYVSVLAARLDEDEVNA